MTGFIRYEWSMFDPPFILSSQISSRDFLSGNNFSAFVQSIFIRYWIYST